MKERLITLFCALGALALFYALFAPKPQVRDTQLSRPTSAESRENGYLAARRWLESGGVRVVSLRERYGKLLSGSKMPPKGNLLIVTLPRLFKPRHTENLDLEKWLKRGNAVLVMAALGDTPDWSMSPEPPVMLRYDVLGVGGILVDSLPNPNEGDGVVAQGPLARPERIELLPNGEHPLFAGVKKLLAETEYPADDWFAQVPSDGFVLSLARERYSDAEGFWLKKSDAGMALISSYASVFTNQMLGQEDNARLLANIVAQTVAPGGAVIFDDMHQGLSQLYHPEAFFGDRRLHYTLALLVGLWLIWVLGGTRLRSARAPRPAPGEGALVRATGGFLARALKPVDAGRRWFELFFNDLRRALGEPQNGEPLWEWLGRRPCIDAGDVTALRALHERLAAGRRVDLKRLQTLTLRVQENAL